MTQSVLGVIVLGYRPLWNSLREMAGVQLFIEVDPVHPVDAAHLLRTISEMWTAHSPPLLLSPQTPQLLCDLLAHAPVGSPWIEVRSQWMHSLQVLPRVFAAADRGLSLIWRGDLGHLPDIESARCFERSLLTLPAEDALASMQTSRRLRRQLGLRRDPDDGDNPALAGQLYEGVASRLLMSHFLDQQGAWALAGWPTEDILHSVRHKAMQPAQDTLSKLIRVIDADESMELIEQIMGEEPILVYRFLVYVNSAMMGLQSGIDSIRRGLMILGYKSLRRWLGEQLAHASQDLDLQPIKRALVLRSHLMEYLLDAGGGGDELRREVYLTGLFSQIDLLMAEPLGHAVQHLPVSERIGQATLSHTGPYATALEIAIALESADSVRLRLLCEENEMSIEDVNRVLLRTLAAVPLTRASSELGERRRRRRNQNPEQSPYL